MIFFKTIALFLLLLFMSITPNNVIADSHDVNKNTEEPLPLNDPFAGNSSLGSEGSILSSGQAGERKKMSLYNFKLVGIISGSKESYVSLVNASGEIITLKLQDELSDGVKLVDMTLNEAVFQKADDTYITINFKNNIKETDVF